VEERRLLLPALDVETFFDGDGDGCGDFEGLCDRIDYLSGLSVDCLWLMPFMPSCQRDDGYDITDFYGVDRRLGTHGDLLDVVRTAREGGMRVIADLVVNHTSNEHPWFRDARRGPESPFHDFYVWRDENPPRSRATSPSRTGDVELGLRRGGGAVVSATASTRTSRT